MPLNTLKTNHSVCGTKGVASGNPIAVPGIRANDVILAIIREKPGEAAAGVAVATFTAADDEIESASVSTTGYDLTVIWTHRN